MSDPTPPAPLLTSAQIAALLRVHPKQVYRLLKRGLPGHRVGGEWRFARDEVLAWVERAPARGRTTAGAPDAAHGEAATPAAASAPALACPPLLAANGDVAIELLLARLQNPGEPLWGFVQADRTRALEWLAEGRVLAAGCHGELPPARVGRERVARLHLVVREVGLAAPPGRPAPTLASLAKGKLAARPRTAGLFFHLAEALREKEIPLERVLRRATTHDSHRSVVCALLRGEADAGLTTRAWAARAGLAFRALAHESYGLLVRSATLGDPAVVRLCEALQGRALRKALGAVQGYDARGAGDIRYDPEPRA